MWRKFLPKAIKHSPIIFVQRLLWSFWKYTWGTLLREQKEGFDMRSLRGSGTKKFLMDKFSSSQNISTNSIPMYISEHHDDVSLLFGFGVTQILSNHLLFRPFLTWPSWRERSEQQRRTWCKGRFEIHYEELMIYYRRPYNTGIHENLPPLMHENEIDDVRGGIFGWVRLAFQQSDI